MGGCIQLLDYLATNKMAKIRFHALEMILNIHSDTSYLSETGAHIRACGHFFMGWMPKDNKPIHFNSSFNTNSTIMRFVVAYAAEAKLGALFHNCQTGIFFRPTLHNLSHPQLKTLVHCNNATAVGTINNTVKHQQLRSMEMRLFAVEDKVAQDVQECTWHPRMKNLANYQNKHHVGSHHAAIRPYYLHQDNSLRKLPHALRPSTLKGCFGTLDGGYVCVCVDLASVALGLSHDGLSSHRAVLPAPLGAAVNKG
jgi:hypothetical protein